MKEMAEETNSLTTKMVVVVELPSLKTEDAETDEEREKIKTSGCGVKVV